MSDPVTKEYEFRVIVPSGYRDARRLAELPWTRESTELLGCSVTVDPDRETARIQGRVRYTVKGNKANDIVRKIDNAARKNDIAISHLKVTRA